MRPTKTEAAAARLGAIDLASKLYHRTASVGVIGMGYVGLPTMVAAAEGGFAVTGIDINEDAVSGINAGRSHIEDVGEGTLTPLVRAGKISATTDYAILNELDVVLVCVPTPITKDKEPDLTSMAAAVAGLANHLRRDQLVVLQSTTFPGTIEEFVLPKLEMTGLKVGKDFYLAFALERIDPGNDQFGMRNVPKIVGGVTAECTKVATDFFSAFVERVIPVSSPKVAEMTKLLENTFRSVNIALVNELAMLCQRMEIDIWEVIEAASTKPFGFMPFYPGPGVGGHCIPVDPFYLSWKAKEYDFNVKFIQLAAQTNDHMPYYTLDRIGEILEDRGQELQDTKLLILGITFKENIKDIRNSPAIRVIELLLEKGANLSYSDPNIPTLAVNGLLMESVDIKNGGLQPFDAVIILVNHRDWDLGQIVEGSTLVIDARNATGPMGAMDHVVKV